LFGGKLCSALAVIILTVETSLDPLSNIAFEVQQKVRDGVAGRSRASP
jgi:hypothetical protein